MDIKKLQEEIYRNRVKQGFNLTGIEKELILLMEELGEAARAYRRKGKEALAEEITDLIVYCLGFHSILGVDSEKELKRKIKVIKKRKYKKTKTGYDIRI